ncbi:AfsR/SARP family transcriptional regulator [Mangrovihabitans endophyticus]|uniref:SARP family transcriptional regulator n=1 Tax=Mangrovihabitans endophyticus TaxID=1751298 RepID=A0A8J3FLX2_9ACTN|nr:BTAD domain-containing putative transcriptional regulator [Mangrovihabitans endophyticus]GGK75234.1 SARP family transcriptional regulator [Mangrovihabitans endophyticus]
MGSQEVSALRFEMLGPLRAARDATPLSLGPSQHRVVLGVLLLHPERPVSRPLLIDAVWGDETPTCAVNLIQRYVSALRRVLEPGHTPRSASGRLVWTDAGYVLSMAESSLDLAVFDAEVSRARHAREVGDLPAAAEALRRASRLWRGVPFDGLTSAYLDGQRDALMERRLLAVEDRIEVELALGNHRELVGELRQLVADNPLRERLPGLLMLALYRCDRQAEALTVYQAARSRLREDLGIDPAAPLRRLHQQILAADESLAAPVSAPASASRHTAVAGGAGPAAPSQLPHSISGFVGRQGSIERLDELMRHDGGQPDAMTIIAIAGTAGVGKTALAVHWAHQVRDAFPDGQLYVNLRGFDPTGLVMQPDEAIRGFLDAFAVPPQRVPVSLDARAALYRSLVAGKRVLVVLDNARDASQVRPLLPGAPGCLVLVTSRDQLSGLVATQNARSVTVDLMSTDESRSILISRLGRTRVAAEDAAVEDIIESCARLPLALTIVAARAAVNPTFSLAVLADQLRDAQAGLDAFDMDDTLTDVRAVFSWSYRTLRPEAARLLRLLGLHRGPDISIAATASLAAVPTPVARRLLTELTRAHLVTEHVPGRFTFHDLLRAYAVELAEIVDGESDRRESIHRVLDHYLHTSQAAASALRAPEFPLTLAAPRAGAVVQEFDGSGPALAWFTAEHPVLLAAIAQAASTVPGPITWRLAWTATPYLYFQGHWRDQIMAQRTALHAAEQAGDIRGQGHAHLSLARACTRLGGFADADDHHEGALSLFAELDDHFALAHVHRSMSVTLDRRERHAEALEHAEQALKLYRSAGHAAWQARALNAVGWYHARLGDPAYGLNVCEQALAMQRHLEDPQGQANTWDSLGYAHHQLGDQATAIACYNSAIERFRELGDRYNETDTLNRLGEAQLAAGDVDAARATWQRALAILDELNHGDADLIRARLALA